MARLRKKPLQRDGIASAAAPDFQPGAEVDVRHAVGGFCGSWPEATVVSVLPGGGSGGANRYCVSRSSLLSGAGDRLAETASATHLRPRPPPSAFSAFSPHDVVEAFRDGGWWAGVVVSSSSSSATRTPSYAVAFPITREVASFPSRLVRPRRDFAAGNWVRSMEAVASEPCSGVETYTAGEKVEVVRHSEAYGPAWFPATVAKAVGEMSYLVEYCGLDSDVEAGTEFLRSQFIRPAVERCTPMGEFEFGPSARVEVLRDGALSPAVVLGAVGEAEHEVRVEGAEAERAVRCGAAALRPRREWNGEQWTPVRSKGKTILKPQSMSGEQFSSPVDMASGNDYEYTRAPESHAEKRLRKESLAGEELQPTQGIALNEKSDHYVEVLPERILTTPTEPIESLADPSGHITVQKGRATTTGVREPSMVNQENQTDETLSDDHLNTSGHEANSNEAHGMLSVAELIASCFTSNTFQQRGEMVQPDQALDRHKETSDIIQLEGGTTSGSSVDALCGLSNSMACKTSVALTKWKENDNAVQIQLGEVADGRTNIEISSVAAKQNKLEDCLVNSSDAASSETGGMVPVTGLKWKSTASHTTCTLYQERKKFTVLTPGGREEATDKIQFEKASRSSTVQQLDKTLTNDLNCTYLSLDVPPGFKPLRDKKAVSCVNSTGGVNAQQQLDRTLKIDLKCTDLSLNVPPGFKPLCNKKAVSCVNSTSDSHKYIADNVCEFNGQARLLEDSMAHAVDGVSQVNRQPSVSEDSMASAITEMNSMIENTSNIHTGITELLSSGCRVKQDGWTTEERSTLLPSHNAESIQCSSFCLTMAKPFIESPLVRDSPSDLHPGKQLLFQKRASMWAIIEAMEVFRKVPQGPHFRPLVQHLPVLREGIALGLMISFANIVESIGKLHIEDSTILFEEKLSALAHLETNGFNVQILQARLDKLLQIKDDLAEHNREKEKIDEQILEKKSNASQMSALIDANDEAILDLEQKLELLRAEKETLTRQKACQDAELLELEMEGSEVHEACENAERHFYDVLAEPW